MHQKIVSYKELIGFFWKFIRKQRWTFSSIFIQDCINTLDSLLWPFILRWVIDIFTQNEVNRALAWESLQAPIIISICLIIFIEINSRSMGFLMAKAIPRLQADIRMTMFDHVQEHSPHYFNERFAGSLANKITDMTTAVESIHPTAVLADCFLYCHVTLWCDFSFGLSTPFSQESCFYGFCPFEHLPNVQ